MKVSNAEKIFDKLEEGEKSSKFIAQANARYILFGVNEPVENFPNFKANLTDGLNTLALTYLSIGSCYAENKLYDKSIEPLTIGASLLEYNHFPKQNRTSQSQYYLLISSLAYYASCQYSKSFIILRGSEFDTDVGRMTSLFLKRDFNGLTYALNNILLKDENSLTSDPEITESKIHSILYAKGISNLVEFIYTGNIAFLNSSREILKDLLELLLIEEEPSLWWVTRLFLIVIDGFQFNSLWSTIPPKLTEYQLTPEKEPVFNIDDLFNLFPTNSRFNKEEQITKFLNSLLFRDKPVIELFVSQREALNKVLNKSGAVVTLPTSSGKTRIAEIAILQALLNNPNGKVLYLAPFRSLAFEIEGVLNQTFRPLNYEVSHLYGGSQFSKVDKSIIQDSHILIATPEKAKAILRVDSDIASQIELIIIDEGHLLDESKRYVMNELFVEELKHYIEESNGKIILLSAVLPNSKEISKWITKDENMQVQSLWRPSSQRFGILEFNKDNVKIAWRGEFPSFNYNFLDPIVVKTQLKTKIKETIFPSDKKEAVALTAVKLSSIGSVLIFVGVANSVLGYAQSVLTALGESPVSHRWKNTEDWISFELACNEAYGENSEVFTYAKFGIICHSADLPNEVRITVERLMRNGNPKVIVSTSTLAQGVNIGVSSVIIANVWISGKTISIRDFWNLAGRGGRAFVDTEGKVLYATDTTIPTRKEYGVKKVPYFKYKSKRKYQIDRDNEMANDYFDEQNLEDAKSGLLTNLNNIFQVANDAGIDFDTLLQLIAENDFSSLSEINTEEGINLDQKMDDLFDWIDDTILSFEVNTAHRKFKKSDWIDYYFRSSLAYIQAQADSGISGEGVIEIIRARNEAIKNKIAKDSSKWLGFVSSGLPLTSIVKLDTLTPKIVKWVSAYLKTDQSIDELIVLLTEIESAVKSLPSSSFKFKYEDEEIEVVRKGWISGLSLKEISSTSENAQRICNDYFGFSMPWVINAMSRKLFSLELVEEAGVLENLALSCELGLPNLLSSKIYLSGIRSRSASLELSQYINTALETESIVRITNVILENKNQLKEYVNDTTSRWIDILSSEKSFISKRVKKINDFTFSDKELIVKTKILNVRSISEKLYLCSPDYKEKIEVSSSTDFPFNSIVDNTAIYFEFVGDTWSMKNRSPYIEIV